MPMHSYSIQYQSRCPKGMASNILPLIILSLYATLLLAWLSWLFMWMMSSFMKVAPSVLLIWNDTWVSYSIQKIEVLFTISFQIKLLILFRVSLSLSLTKVICTWSFPKLGYRSSSYWYSYALLMGNVSGSPLWRPIRGEKLVLMLKP